MPGAASTRAYGINAAGQIVGVFDDRSGRVHGYVRSPKGAFEAIDVPGAAFTEASGINRAGQVVGFFRDAAGREHGFATR